MEIGIDSFAGAHIDPKTGKVLNPELQIQQLLDRMVYADEMGLYSFAIGEHYRKEFLDSANIVILAAAARTNKKYKVKQWR